ncbi:MAG: hypothetical protein AABX44_00145 [Nanoarchaeota archaeon]
MKILGINFTKLNAEKFSSGSKSLNIGTNMNISEIKELKSDFFSSKEKALGIKFIYEIDYEPNFAKINLVGNILVSTDEANFNQILEGWKEKKLPDDFRISIFNLILKKSSLRALQLEEEINLPLHIAMPYLKSKEKSQDPEQTKSSSK